MSDQQNLDAITAILRQTGGYFVFPDADGTEYVITRKTDFDQLKSASNDVQLDLLSRPADEQPSADAMLGKINRDIALWQLTQTEDETTEPAFDDLGIDQHDTAMPTKRVRFEPLKGDLSPDLQE